MMSESTAAAAGGASVAGPGERWVSCEIPGCVHWMPYAGRGAPSKYCGRTVDGVQHTRLTAHRLSTGQITLPVPGSGPSAAAHADPEQRSGEAYGGDARPVTAARMTLELLLADVAHQVASHEQRMAVLAEQITAAVCTAADPAAAAAEVAAAHRAARADIDAAEAERDQAIGAAREAARAAEEAQERATLAETVAEEALTERDTAEHHRDHAIQERDELAATEAVVREERDTAHAQTQSVQAEWDRTNERLTATTAELATARAQIEALREQLATTRHEVADLATARTELTQQLAGERAAVEAQRRRAETAEQHATRATGHAEHLTTELTTARGHAEHWQAQASEHRAELAGVRSELTAAHTATETAHDHAGQRLADQQARYEDLVSELRHQINQLRATTTATQAEPTTQRGRTGRQAPTSQ